MGFCIKTFSEIGVSGLYLLHLTAALIGAAVTIAAFADAMESYETLGNKLTEIDVLAGKL